MQMGTPNSGKSLPLLTRTLNEMMAKPSEPEAEAEQELEYRRGFADGIGAFFQQLDDLPAEIVTNDLVDAIWAWWGKLVLWEHSNALEAPAFEWRTGNAGLDH